MLERELQQVARSLEEVVAMVSEDSISQMEEVNAEGLLAVVEKKAQGEDVAPDEVVEVQVSPQAFLLPQLRCVTYATLNYSAVL